MRNDKDKYYDELNKYRRFCKKCGWGTNITNKYKKKICPSCGNMVFLDDKEEFKYRMRGIVNEK